MYISEYSSSAYGSNVNKTGSTVKNKASPAEDMSMEEYKAYIYMKISGTYKSSMDNMVLISDEGYKAMKEDPEYEKWVLEQVGTFYRTAPRSDRNRTYHSALFVGATREECRSECWYRRDKAAEEKQRQEKRQLRLRQKAKAEKKVRYRRVLAENALKKAQKERDHQNGVFRDQLYAEKNVCAALSIKIKQV